MGGAVKTGNSAALDLDLLITVMGVAAEAVAVKGNPVTTQRVIWPPLIHPFASQGMHPNGLIDFLKLREAAGGCLPTGHARGHGKASRRLPFSLSSRRSRPRIK